ncbi:MAG: type II toxin-antitoxin system PemK/MazF family toxin [Dehalococcoidales bacterium]|nr:type II toxin-antitoxin system PemK/MazF family toxin [Dehalococcoidales bacterium]
MKRGEIWWAELAAPIGRRPVLLLTRNNAYNVRNSVTVAPVTRTIRAIPSQVFLSEQDGMMTPCVVNLDDLATINVTKLKEYLTTLSSERMQAVNRAVIFALDLK